MKKPLKLRRYLVHFTSYNIPQVFTDTVVLGSGAAGFSAALAATTGGSVLMVTKGDLQEGCTNEAQGGIAAAIRDEDSPEEHFQDTVKGGLGLCDEEMVRIMTEEGPHRIGDLLDAGMPFDRNGESLSFTREGGHNKARILHANGDATGAALHKSLREQVFDSEEIEIFDHTYAIDLLTARDGCQGALVWNEVHGLLMVRAKQTILATGGCGREYRETTNPGVVTGDGMAMAFRAGADLQDMEFVQFHPTALYVAGASRALISESLRGEGAVLRNKDGERFMPRYDENAELAPRDKVSRSIIQETKRTGHTHVYLDMTSTPRDYLENRFPTITRLCEKFDLDVATDQIPVRPAAHYMIGGVKTDEQGQTNLDDLLACGEVACTGVHGANRLGSNSLLEGLVFGHRAGLLAAERVKNMKEPPPLHAIQGLPQEPTYGHLNLRDVEDSLRSVMWRLVGVERNEEGLNEAVESITFWCRYIMDKEFDQPRGWELQNLLTVARIITMSARQREESRGVHFRTDFPQTSPDWRRHIVISNTGDQWL